MFHWEYETGSFNPKMDMRGPHGKCFGVPTQFPESQFYPNPTVKFIAVLIWNIIVSQPWTWVWILSNFNQGLFYPTPEILILSTIPNKINFILLSVSAPQYFNLLLWTTQKLI